MKKLLLPSLLFTTVALYAQTLQNTTCKRCHPKIFEEYQHSMHRNASIFNDPIHKAVWDKHPAKKKNNYKCAICHTPADQKLLEKGGAPTSNPTQLQEPISCQTCHTIESIQEHAKANKNIYTTKPKTFFTKDENRKGEKLTFKEKSSFFGLIRTTEGSPYHDIDYGNKNFYTGKLCLGCHDHKQNAKGFTICDMQIKPSKDKNNCITCHMPKIKGSFANQRKSQTHAYHGSNIVTASPQMLAKYITLDFHAQKDRFSITITNKANHTLFPHPLRVGALRISIQSGTQKSFLAEKHFLKVIGTDGKPSSPWLADAIIKDTTIKAFEKREITYQKALQKGDKVVVEFGYYIVNPKMAPKLGITNPKYTKFTLFKKKVFIK